MIVSDVYKRQDESNAEQWNPADRMTSYDTLMKDYVRDRESFEAALILSLIHI